MHYPPIFLHSAYKSSQGQGKGKTRLLNVRAHAICSNVILGFIKSLKNHQAYYGSNYSILIFYTSLNNLAFFYEL